jgi:gold/copper resistance efflux system membrane fusion protein
MCWSSAKVTKPNIGQSELGPMVEGMRVNRTGVLQPGERIVVKGLVRPGMQITPQTTP